MRVLDGVNARSLAGFGWESFAWVRCTGFADGGLPMGSIPGSARVMGDLMGRHFGWVVDFFLGGAGEGKRSSRARLLRRFSQTTRVPNSPYMFILYIAQWKFRCSHAKGHRERWSRSSMPWADTCAVRASTTRRPSSRIEDGEGAAAPRSATDSTEQWV